MLQVTASGPIQKMEPLTVIQVALKNNVGVVYFASSIPMNVFFVEDGAMGECER